MNYYLMAQEVCKGLVTPPFHYEVHPSSSHEYLTVVIAGGSEAVVMGFTYQRGEIGPFKVNITSSVPLLNQVSGHTSEWSMSPKLFTQKWVSLALHILKGTW